MNSESSTVSTWIQAGDVWSLWACILMGVAAALVLEHRYRWAAKVSGPVLALVGAMILSNTKLLPVEAPTYDLIDTYLVPLAIPLLLFHADARRIMRETGSMFAAFHVATLGTLLGGFLAAFLFRGAVPQLAEVTGVMTASYTGGAVNFMAVKTAYQVDPNLANPLIVADNFIMAGMFAVLLLLSGSVRMLQWFARSPAAAPSEPREETGGTVGHFWRRKEISLLDLALGLCGAMLIAALAIKISGWLNGELASRWARSFLGNAYAWITLLTVLLATFGRRWTENVRGTEEVGTLLLYLFFFAIGLRANLWVVFLNVPVLFLFCLVIAVTNLAFTLLVGRLLHMRLDELLLSVNATLGGAPSAAAMAIAKGWTDLIVPGLLAGIWGYVIGTFLGVATAELLLRML